MIRTVLALALFCVASFASAQTIERDTTVEDYLAAWDAVNWDEVHAGMKRGDAPDIENDPKFRVVSGELEEIAADYRAEIAADRAAGAEPPSCLPEGEAEVSSDDLLPFLRSYAAEGRGHLPLSMAFAALMAQTYPCE